MQSFNEATTFFTSLTVQKNNNLQAIPI
jgi:hypothetical protein